jgi:hypothetical protein
MKEISKAIIAVMKEVKNIEKGMSVGTGKSSYRAISDSMVRNEVKKSMTNNGLAIIPINVNATVRIDRWEEADSYNGGAMKTKQSVFTEAHTKYLLLHESGEGIEIAGYGHGVDTQDKGAGKATTYALKNAILDTFLIIKGDEMDPDKTHSDDIDIPQKPKVKTKEEIFEMVKRDIDNAKSIDDCIAINKKLTESKVVDESQKIDLAFILQDKMLTFDPTSE